MVKVIENVPETCPFACFHAGHRNIGSLYAACRGSRGELHHLCHSEVHSMVQLLTFYDANCYLQRLNECSKGESVDPRIIT